MAPYLSMEQLLRVVDPEPGDALGRMLEAHEAAMRTAPGSRRAHQAWEGGWWDHTLEVMNLALRLYHAMDAIRPLPFTRSDALVVLWLHDLEKPFRYTGAATLDSKEERKRFRRDMIARFRVPLTDDQRNALDYVEGEGDDYAAGERVMGSLAAFCHMCDIASARIWHDRPREGDEVWGRRSRGV